jgi:chaperonin cofactor prefoldin
MSNDGKTVDIQSAFSRLATESASLNKYTQEVNETVSAIEEEIKKFNIGQEIWVDIDEVMEPTFIKKYRLGYANRNSVWGFVVTAVTCDLLLPQHEKEIGDWTFKSAPRRVRLLAVENIPSLLEKLAKRVETLARKARNSASKAQEILSSINPAQQVDNGMHDLSPDKIGGQK